jgi:hypothetical protein
MWLQLLPELDRAASEARQSWDSFRLEVVRRCVDLTLLPSLQTELRRDLVRLGREAVIEEAALNFETMLRVGPYRRPNLDRREKVKELLLASPRTPGGQHSVVSIFVSQDRGQGVHMVYLNKVSPTQRPSRYVCIYVCMYGPPPAVGWSAAGARHGAGEGGEESEALAHQELPAAAPP